VVNVKDSALKVVKLWGEGLDRWRGPIDVFWFLYFAAYLCVGRDGLEGALGFGGQTVLVAATLFLVFVLPFFHRAKASQ
jgi:hypothetical protein